MPAMLEVRGLAKSYDTPAGPLRILDGIDLSLREGQSASIVGPSGSGKSTLLFILGALEFPSAGTVALDGEAPFELAAANLADFRNRKVGFVFQDHHLLPQCTVLENILVPTLVGPDSGAAEQRARELIERIGLAARLDHRPAALSGGERQRVAIARALIRQPKLLLCDEPTGNLDHSTSDVIASLLLEIHRETKTILVVVTHNLELAQRFDCRFSLSEGRLHPFN